MNNTQNKVKRGIIALIMGAVLIAIIGGTYSRYMSSGTVNSQIDIAKWHVTLNGQNISSESKNIEATLVYDNNNYVKNGKIAPGRTGHFDVELDPSGSEVAIDYALSVDATGIATSLEENSQSEISVIGATYRIGSGEAQSVTATNGVINISESLAQVQEGDKVTVTVTIAWDNDTDNNSSSDTKEGTAAYDAGVDGKIITVPVTVLAQQKI